MLNFLRIKIPIHPWKKQFNHSKQIDVIVSIKVLWWSRLGTGIQILSLFREILPTPVMGVMSHFYNCYNKNYILYCGLELGANLAGVSKFANSVGEGSLQWPLRLQLTSSLARFDFAVLQFLKTFKLFSHWPKHCYFHWVHHSLMQIFCNLF